MALAVTTSGAGRRLYRATGAVYEAVRRVGEGSFGQVWQVRETATGRLRALKQLRAEWEDHRTARRLLENEAEVGRAVDSPHVVRVLDAQLRATPRFVVLEWLAGETLEAELGRSPRLPVHRALWLARQCVRGLVALQAAKLIHGDLKPSNAFICRDGTVKLIDLGFARPVGSPASDLTGTPEYLAPEVLAGEASQHGRDLYGVGVMLYRMLTGRMPFHGATVSDVVAQQQSAGVVPVRSVSPLVPREVAALAERLLSKQPLRRAPGLGDLLNELLVLEVAALTDELRCASS
jgi:serine/threonine protein kinase